MRTGVICKATTLTTAPQPAMMFKGMVEVMEVIAQVSVGDGGRRRSKCRSEASLGTSRKSRSICS